LLEDRKRYLDAYFQDDILSYRHYFEERISQEEEAQRKILAAQDEQILAAQQFTKRRDLTPDERLNAEQKLGDLIYKRMRQEAQGEQMLFDLRREQTRAMREYEDAVAEVSAKMKELAGDTAGAARIRFEQQTRQLRLRAAALGDTGMLANLDALNAEDQARAKLSLTMERYQSIIQDVSVEQARIDLAQRSGALTTIEAMERRSDVARRYIVVLTAQANAAEQAARALAPGPAQTAALQNVDRLRLEIDQLKAVTTELEDSIRVTFEDAFADSLISVVDGTKSVSEAFTDMANQIQATLLRMAAQNIAESIFGKLTGGGGGFDLFGSIAGIFKGGGGLFGGGGFGELFGFAAGGPIAGNRPAIVGERGPEIFMPRAAGNILPFIPKSSEPNQSINISVNVAPSTSRSTADQVAAETARAVRRAATRVM
jgi:uncharacterized membrane protein YgcG